MSDNKKITWSALAFMAFSTVWGFGNVLNGFIYFNGIQVILSWVMMFVLYFIPYSLMVGELGSAFKNSGGGVNSWVYDTIGPKVAYYAGWTYWACHITYIASKGSGSLKALSWAVFRNAETYDTFPTIAVQMATLGVFLIGCFIASKGMNPLKKLLSLAGTSMFVMSILYIIMMLAAPAINPGADYVTIDFSLKNLIPNFNIGYFTSLSILVFAVGGCEKMSPYVNKVENPSKGFPKGIIAMTVMVLVCAMLGTVAMGRMFDPAVINASEESFNSYAANGSYWAFQKLGEYYHLGDTFLIIYALCNLIGQFSILILSIDAPLRMLLDNEKTAQFIPSGLRKKNKYGAYSNGIKLVMVCMPLRYTWVFVAYIALRKAYDRIPAEYRFVKNQKIAYFFGGWCLFVTLICCIMGMYNKDPFTFAMNVVTPVVLTALGIIMPKLAERERAKGSGK